MVEHMASDEVAAMLGVSPRTVEGWRARKQGPPFARVGGLVKYDRAGVVEWLKGQTVHAEKKGGD